MPPLNNTPGTNHDYKKVEMIIKMALNHILTLLAGPWQTWTGYIRFQVTLNNSLKKAPNSSDEPVLSIHITDNLANL